MARGGWQNEKTATNSCSSSSPAPRANKQFGNLRHRGTTPAGIPREDRVLSPIPSASRPVYEHPGRRALVLTVAPSLDGKQLETAHHSTARSKRPARRSAWVASTHLRAHDRLRLPADAGCSSVATRIVNADTGESLGEIGVVITVDNQWTDPAGNAFSILRATWASRGSLSLKFALR